MGKTIMVVKPHLVVRGQAARVMEMIIATGLDIESSRLIRISRSQAEDLYAGHSGRDYFPWLVDQLAGQPVRAFLIAGDDAARRARGLAGPTKPEVARIEAPNSIRALLTPAYETFALSREQGRAVHNCVHTPDPEEEGAVEREGKIFFPNAF